VDQQVSPPDELKEPTPPPVLHLVPLSLHLVVGDEADDLPADLDALREAGGPAVPAPAIVERPSAERFAAAFADFSRAAPTPLLLAPTTLANLADRSRVATVEVSFPRCRDHALAPQPLCGFAGLAVLAGRIVNAVGRVT